jgi:DNA-directed RNA polymerase specialized sigma24 family protein
MAGILVARMSRYAKKALRPYSGTRQRFPDLEEAACDLVSHVWEIILGNPKGTVHAERRFGQFFHRQTIDFLRRSFAAKRIKVQTFTEKLGDVIDDEGRLPEEILSISEDVGMDPADWLEYKQLMEHANLTENEREAVVLRFGLGLPLESKRSGQSSISKHMGKTPRTIHSYLKSAQGKLRSAMK